MLLKAKQENLIPSVSPLIEILQKNGIRLSEAVVAEALRLAGED
jgi:predicted nucleic acid-binding protein